ncbi:MAG: DUF5684 domain-containing protein [Eubacterium sp.]|nr:DUF5684 domain-containing protein [Eubacterium sp.]
MYNFHGAETGFFAVLGGMIIFVALFALAVYVVQAIGMWKMFEKAGKAGWRSIIPFLNVYDLFDLAWNQTMAIAAVCIIAGSIVIGVIPILGALISSLGYIAYFVLHILCSIKVAKAYGKDGAYAVGLIFLPVIFYCILGFGDSEYQGQQG